MNWSDIEGNWTQFKGLLKETWGDITDDDLIEIAGKRERMIGKLQTLYDIDKDRAIAMLEKGLDGIDIQGEGNYKASRKYQKEQHEFAENFTGENESHNQ